MLVNRILLKIHILTVPILQETIALLDLLPQST